MSKSLELKADSYTFTLEEFKILQKLFKKTAEKFKIINPYQSFYQLADKAIFDTDKLTFQSRISYIYETYYKKLKELSHRLEKALIGKSNFAFKYLDFVDSDDSTLNDIQKNINTMPIKLKT